MRKSVLYVLFVFALIGSLLPLKPVRAATCYGSGCAGRDPVQTGCYSGSTVLSGAPVYAYGTEGWVIGKIELRYSDACKTKWSRIIPYNYSVYLGGPIYNNSYGFMKKVGISGGYNLKYGVGIINTAMIYGPGVSWQACGAIKITNGYYYITCTGGSTK